MSRKLVIPLKSIALVTLLTLALIKVTDLALVSYLPLQHGFLYKFLPHSKAVYKTREFDVVASINRFGFRGKETEIKEGQILVIGDSMTFGWGLREDEVWARLLEANLRSSGLDLSVYNLGVPGTDSAFHLEAASTFVKTLKPKFVVISVLVGDDFQQVLEKRARDSATTYSRTLSNVKLLLNSAKASLKQLFPGLHKFYANARYQKSVDSAEPKVVYTTDNWAEESSSIVRDNKIHLPDEIRERVAAGDINPYMLSMLKYPDRAHRFWGAVENGPDELSVLAELSRAFSDVSSVTREAGGRLVIFSMPDGTFVNSEHTKNYRKYGHNIPEAHLFSYKPETVLAEIGRDSDALFVPSLTEFRRHKGAELFFPLDGHLTPEGSRLVADIISKALLDQAGIR